MFLIPAISPYKRCQVFYAHMTQHNKIHAYCIVTKCNYLSLYLYLLVDD